MRTKTYESESHWMRTYIRDRVRKKSAVGADDPDRPAVRGLSRKKVDTVDSKYGRSWSAVTSDRGADYNHSPCTAERKPGAIEISCISSLAFCSRFSHLSRQVIAHCIFWKLCANIKIRTKSSKVSPQFSSRLIVYIALCFAVEKLYSVFSTPCVPRLTT